MKASNLAANSMTPTTHPVKWLLNIIFNGKPLEPLARYGKPATFYHNHQYILNRG